MNELHKLAEARYFLHKLKLASHDPQEYSFVLSAFLSAARSVLQYALEEAKTKSGGQKWYEDHTHNTPSVKYFKDKRDLSIHVEPVLPKKHISLKAHISVSISTSLKMTVIDKDGNVIEERSASTPPEPTAPSSSSISVSYHFGDWQGPENIDALCQQYFSAINSVVMDGQARGFLSP